MSRLNLISCIWRATFLFACLGAVSSDRCRLFVTKSSIQHSWQSSGYPPDSRFCFENRSVGEDRVNTYQYMHTNQGNSSTDKGAHFFVVRLNKPELISSVNLKARTLTKMDQIRHGDNLNARAAEIEIWTSQGDVEFGTNHCSSRTISSTFDNAKSHMWTLCGSTPTNVSSGDTLTVQCIRDQVKTILLRKNVVNETLGTRQSMCFVNMWIDLRMSSAATEFRASNNALIEMAKQNTSLTVRCRVECPGDISLITLNHVDRNKTVARGNQLFVIWHAQPSDAGNYTCNAGGAVLSYKYLQLLYPPIHLQAAMDDGACSVESPKTLSFFFKSSASVPTPHHECTALDLSGRPATLKKLTTSTEPLSSSLISDWICDNCCNLNGLIVSCTAIQVGETNQSLVFTSRISRVFLLRKFSRSAETIHPMAWFQWTLICALLISLAVVSASLVKMKKRLNSLEHQLRSNKKSPEAPKSRMSVYVNE